MPLESAVSHTFPSVTRVVYGKSPLINVAWQARFHPVLEISNRQPAEFQAAIRDRFPQFQQAARAAVQGPFPDLPLRPGQRTIPEFLFVSTDGATTVSLTQDTVTIQTNAYSRAELLWEPFEVALKALQNVYGVAEFVRVGARYIDLVSRDNLGVPTLAWDQLLNPLLIGVLADHQVDGTVEEANARYRFRTPNQRGLLLQHGLVQVENSPELAYIIDFDSYCVTSISYEQIPGILEELRTTARNAFRWCITTRLHELLQPRPA
jgi:uncharacterized protein (TIGR04255 family)